MRYFSFEDFFKMHIFLIVIFIWTYGYSEGRPNIIIILADDLGWNDLSFHGSPQISTPNLDSLAEEGIILNNHYVAPLCTPSRAALMTGLYPIRLGLQHHVLTSPEPKGLPLNHTLLPEYLRNIGYATHAVGKWHLGFFKREYTPIFRGFDSHYGYWSGVEDYYEHIHMSLEEWSGLDFHYNMEPVTDQSGKYSTELFANQAANIILHHNFEKPLFLYVAHQAVHVGNKYDYLQAPLKYVSRFPHIQDERRKLFAGMVSAMDDSMKVIMDALKEKNELHNSIILFSTDNGGPPADGNIASNWPLRGAKDTLFEGGVRGISFIWSPLFKKSKRTSMDLIHIVDWLPTLYYAAGGDPLDLGFIDGYNMWDTLSEGTPSRRSEVLLNIDPIRNVSGLRLNNYKVIQGTTWDGEWDSWFGPSGRDNSTFNDAPNKMTEKQPQFKSELLCGNVPKDPSPCYPAEAPCLFDVDVDPCEYNNIAAENPEVLKILLERLSFYEKEAVPPIIVPRDPNSNPIYHNNQWVCWMDNN